MEDGARDLDLAKPILGKQTSCAGSTSTYIRMMSDIRHG